MAKQQRRTDVPFSVTELEFIYSCIQDDHPLELVGTEDTNFKYAIQVQLPHLFNAWRAKERSDAEMFYEVGSLINTIKTKKEFD